MKNLLLLIIIGASLACTGSTSVNHENRKVLLISFDGFRADYLTKTETPNFDKLVENGVISEGMIPVFPSKTFPNHYAIATGLYPENNGLVGNSMYDPDMDLSYAIRDREQVENPAWYLGEPIWNTVEKQGKKAGTMFWVGSEAPVQGMRPTFWKKYDGKMPNTDRIDSVLNWMTLGTDQEVDFGTLYFDFTDGAGHRYGPESEEIIEAIQLADSLVGYLTAHMIEKGLDKTTNVIIVADHGMQGLSRERLVFIDDYINLDDVHLISSSPVIMLNAKPGKLEEVYDGLKEGEDHFTVYKKEDLPDRFHLQNNSRTPDITISMDLGYTMSTHEFADERPNYPSGGTHGFDNINPEMYAIFVASGPDIKSGLTIEPFENVHVFELIAYLLDLESPGTDGDLEVLKPVLNN